MDDDDDAIRERLRRLGEVPVDPVTASAHLAAMAGVRARPAWHRPLASVAAGALVIGVAVGVLVAGGDRASVDVVPAAEQQQAPTPEDAFRCTGPPPWAGHGRAGAGAGDADVDREAFRQWRAANCPADDDADPGRAPVAPSYGPEDFTCTGPPPWAGTPARGAPGQRSADARARSEWRAANCPHDVADDEPGD